MKLVNMTFLKNVGVVRLAGSNPANPTTRSHTAADVLKRTSSPDKNAHT